MGSGKIVFELHRNQYIAADVPIIYQDNKSAIQIVTKGHGNFKNSKHIRVRYSFIRDLVTQGEITIQWQPTADMVSDMLSKGVRWSTFTLLLSRLIGQR